MPHILTLNDIAPVGLERFPDSRYQVGPAVSDPSAILLRSYKMHDMDVPVSVEAVGRAGAGVNNIPIDRMSEAGVVVFNAPGANANAVKELVLAGMLLAARNITPAWDYVRHLNGDNAVVSSAVEKGKKQFAGFELPGRTLGVVGLGAIGVKVANAAHDLGMNVLGFDPHMTVEGAWRLSSDVEPAASIEQLFARSDFISFHVPLNDATRGLLGAPQIANLKPGAIVLNFARGGVVDEVALLPALDSGNVSAYVTDFPTAEMKDHQRVIALPHLGASTREAEENCAVMVANQVRDYLETGNVINSVNFPATQLPLEGSQRICVVNSNIPDMVAKISHVLGKAKLNIVHMRNDSRGNLAYTMLDIEKPADELTLTGLREVEGVRRVRALDIDKHGG